MCWAFWRPDASLPFILWYNERMKSLFFIFLFFALAFASPAQTRGADDEVIAPIAKSTSFLGEETVKEVLKSDMVLVGGDKRYRLSDILIPVEYDMIVMRYLEDLLRGKKIKIYLSKTKIWENGDESIDVDRYGIPLANLILEGGSWVQGDLVQNGMAMAYNTEGFGSDRMKMLLEMEAAARKEKLGFWSNPLYGIKTPETVKDFADSFQIVEGKISYVSVKETKTFLNFGKDWKTDFTLEIPAGNWRNFYVASKLFDAEAWRGRQVRVRGWVQEKNGPMIEINNKDQIEFLNTESVKAAPGKAEPSQAEPSPK